MRTTNARIWDAADEADRLADLVQRRLIDNGNVKVLQGSLGLLAKIREELAAIKRLSNDKAGGA